METFMSDSLKVIPSESDVKTGVRDKEGIAVGLNDVLADTYRLTFKTHAYHWAVQGPQFYSIHKLTEEQYENLFAAADELAERCRALGALTPFQFNSLIERSVIEDPKELPSAREMVEDLATDHERVAHRMHALIEMAGSRNDPVTDDLCTGRSAFHEKAAWMLRSIAAE
jgi:starvation-inducible DNA-binding protein